MIKFIEALPHLLYLLLDNVLGVVQFACVIAFVAGMVLVSMLILDFLFRETKDDEE